MIFMIFFSNSMSFLAIKRSLLMLICRTGPRSGFLPLCDKGQLQEFRVQLNKS